MRDWLKEARKEAGLTCKEMGNRLGISEAMYFRIETGERQPNMSLETAVKISRILKLPIMTIINYETR